MAPHSSTLDWKIPWTEEPGGLQSVGSLRVGHDWATSLSLCFQSLSCVWLCDPMNCSTEGSLFFTISLSLLKFMFTELVVLSNHVILCLPILLLPSLFPRIRVFSNELALCIRWLKYWSLAPASVPPWIFRVDSFRINWFELLAVQGTLL